MRHWIAAHALTTCGFAGCAIAEGQPVQVIQIGGLPPRYRCQAHAEGQVDWDEVQDSKASHAPARQAERGFVRTSQIRTPFDSKLAASGGDE